MPVLAMSAGRVTAIWGSAFVRLPDGTLKPLQVGDKVAGGERIITEENGMVQISPISPVKNPVATVKLAEPTGVVDKAIAGVEAHEADQAPAAGLTGGADGGLQLGLRVDRVVEPESGRQQSFDFDASDRAPGGPNGPSANQRGESRGDGEPAVALSKVGINDVVVNEGAGTATFTVTLDKASSSVVKVSFSTGDATAGAGADYVKTLGAISFEPGQLSKTITVPIVNDRIYEGSERFVVQLSDASNAVISKGQGAGEILDDGRGSVPVGVTPDDDRPHVVEVSSPSAHEGGELNFVLKLAPISEFDADPSVQHRSAYDTPLTLTLSGVGDHPVSVADFVHGVQGSLDGGITFLDLSVDAQGHVYGVDGSPWVLPADSSTTPIIIKVLTTPSEEHTGPQAIELSASSPFDAAPAHGVGTIDVPYLLVQSGEPAVEGQPVVFDVVLTYAINHDVTVKLDLQSGVDDPDTPQNESATLGLDTGEDLQYRDASGQWHDLVDGTVTISAGQTLVQVRVATVDDGVAEDTEFIKLHAHVEETGLTANTDQANQTAIVDNDLPYLLVQSGEAAVEGQPVMFDVVLTHGLDQAVTIKLDLQSGEDYPETPQNESAAVGVDTGTQLEYQDASGQWHEVVGGAVTMDAWQTLLHVRVATVDDGAAEDTEYIKLHAAIVEPGLTHNAEHANQTAIVDNDLPYMLIQSGEPAVEGLPVVFNVVLTHALDQAVTIKLDLQSGVDDLDTPQNESATVEADTATQLEYLDGSGQWHQVVDGAVTLDAGQTQVQVRVATVDDTYTEDTEYIKLHAAIVEPGLTANAEHANQTAIVDNDLPYMLVQSGEPVLEGAPIVFDVTLTHAAASDVTVALALASGIDDERTLEHESATVGADTGSLLEYLDGNGNWVALPEDGHVTFTPGDTLIQVRVATNLDNRAEDTEYIKLNATVLEDGLTANKAQFNQTAILDDDSVPGVLAPIHLQVSQAEQVLEGNLSANGAIGQPGGLFEHVSSVTVDGLVHDFDAGQPTLDLTTTHGAQLMIDMVTGHFNYVAPVSEVVGSASDVIDFSLLDQQHQVVFSTLDIKLDHAGNGLAGDALDLRDLLQGENTIGGTGNLDHYLAFDTDTDGTVIKVSPNGELVDGHVVPGSVIKDIALPGVDLRSELGLDVAASNVQIIARLLDQGKLLVDHG